MFGFFVDKASKGWEEKSVAERECVCERGSDLKASGWESGQVRLGGGSVGCGRCSDGNPPSTKYVYIKKYTK